MQSLPPVLRVFGGFRLITYNMASWRYLILLFQRCRGFVSQLSSWVTIKSSCQPQPCNHSACYIEFGLLFLSTWLFSGMSSATQRKFHEKKYFTSLFSDSPQTYTHLTGWVSVHSFHTKDIPHFPPKEKNSPTGYITLSLTNEGMRGKQIEQLVP